MSRLLDALHSGRVLVMDGAMGTELQRLGLRDDECSALWNVTHPEQVARVHAAYRDAGAEVLLSNTFVAHPKTLRDYGIDDRCEDIWNAAFGSTQIFQDPAPIVLADVGPFDISRFSVRPILSWCRSADGVLFETWSPDAILAPEYEQDMQRMGAVFQEPHSSPPMPVLISYAYSSQQRMRLETLAIDCADAAVRLFGACALGANCGRDVDMDDLLKIVRAYRSATDAPIFIRPNAGTPTRTAAGWQYPHSPEEMADKLWPLLEAGVTMVGGCCGTTPAHIAAFRRVVDDWNAKQ